MTNIKVEKISLSDFNHICRTCSSSNELKPLFENIETLSMLESFTQMQFSKTDELPDKICTNCLTKISECFNFINNCKIVDEKFRKCLNENINELDINIDELHSSIEIKDEPIEEETVETPLIDLTDEEPEKSINPENIKEIDLKQSEYYIMPWSLSKENQEHKNLYVPATNSSNNQDLIEEQTLRRARLASKLRRFHAMNNKETTQKPQDYKKTLIEVNEMASAVFDQRIKATNDEGHHHARAKLTLPHDEHNYIMRRNLETPERIIIRRAIFREQMRKYRSKLTAEETAQHRAQATERMRKYRTRSDAIQPTVLDPFAPKMHIPLRLSELAQTLLRPRDSVDTGATREMSRFSLRPTKIPQVMKHCFESKGCTSDNQRVTKFRSWKRPNETPEEVTIRLANNSLQMKRFLPMKKEPGPLEESALRRAKAAGQLRQYRPMLRKNKTIPVSNVQTGK